MALLSRLPEQQAEVIMLRVVAGLDTEAVAGDTRPDSRQRSGWRRIAA